MVIRVFQNLASEWRRGKAFIRNPRELFLEVWLLHTSLSNTLLLKLS